MMELKITKTEKILLVFAMILAHTVILAETAEPTSKKPLDPRTVKEVEKRLLKLLGIKSRPIVNREKTWIPKKMTELYQKQMSQQNETIAVPLPGGLARSANTVRSYTHQESEIDYKFHDDRKFRLYFNISNFPDFESLLATELTLNIVPKENRNLDCSSARLRVHDIIEPGIKGKSKPLTRKIAEVDVNMNDSSISIDVLPMVQRWLSNYRNTNHGLLVTVRTAQTNECSSPVRLKRSATEDHSRKGWGDVQPILFLYTKDKRLEVPDAIRKKRSARLPSNSNNNSKKKSQQECRRHHLVVKFQDVGWNDWIVAPSEYDAYFCAGECPAQYSDNHNMTNHAIMQSLVHTVHPTAIPKPCCVPVVLARISMLYLDENNHAVLKNYDDMVVEGCGCR